MKLLAIFLFCMPCSAQFPYSGVTWQHPSGASPDSVLPSGIAFRWEASDLLSSPVSIWTDRIQSRNWVQTTALNKPTTNGSLTIPGVNFDGVNQFLTSTNLASASWNFLLVMKMADVSSQHMLLGDSTVGGHIYVGMSSPGAFYEGNFGGNAVNPIGNLTYDMIGIQGKMYTNGISAWSVALTYWNDVTTISAVGATAAGAWKFSGTIYKFIVWTNQGATWTSTTVSNVHWYATNTVPHTP